MIWRVSKKISVIILLMSFFVALTAGAETVNIDASKLVSSVEVSFSPSSGSFVEGSTFEVPIIIDTKGASINGVDIRIDFDPSRLVIVRPSSGVSIIGVWVGPPEFDNARGTVSYTGVVPGGMVSSSGVIATMTFKALRTGDTSVSVRSDSSVLLNDGSGSKAAVGLGSAHYKIIPKAPGGVNIFSETHQFSSNWYNNNSPVVSWDKDPGVVGFSYVLDNNPSTVPGNVINSAETTKSFENLADGLWYFHIKANKAGVWGAPGHFLIKIDTTPPADFKPQTNFVVAATVLVERTLVSFFTTDNLSGIDHYEVGVIDKSQPVTVSPVFVQAESPFQVPISSGSKLQVIVRAIDKAGNTRDASIDVKVPFVLTQFIQDYLVYILIFIILAGLVGLIIHYLIGHHIIRYMRRIISIMKREDAAGKANIQPLPPTVKPNPPMIVPPS